MSQHSRRQLAAILFADIVGYSALMGADEARAFKAINHFKSIAQPLIDQYQGLWHKDLGDGALCSFDSAFNAVQAAVAIQQRLNMDADYRIRIGIHLGDVTFQNGDVFGDGVNIAARIQGEAAEGGICMSEEVFNTIRNKGEIEVEYLGRKVLKNISKRIRLYQVKAKGVTNASKLERGMISWYYALLLAVALSFLSGLLVWFLMSQEKPYPPAVERLDLLLPEEKPLALVGSASWGLGQRAFALSPDGSLLVYAGREGQSTQLFLRQMDQFTAEALPGTEGAFYPFFSPDGKWIAYFTKTELKKIPAGGGNPVSLCDVNVPLGGTWTRSDEIIFSNYEGGELHHVSAKGIAKHSSNLIMKGKYLAFPALIPDEEYVLLSSKGLYNSGILAISLPEGKVIKKILEPGFAAQYLPTGNLLFTLKGKLMVVPFDAKNLAVKGQPVSLVDDLRTESEYNSGQFAISDHGTLMYVSGHSADLGHLIYKSFNGKEEPLPLDPDYFGECQLSPNGNKVALSFMTPGVKIFDLKTKTSNTIANAQFPRWDPSGDQLYYSVIKDGQKAYRTNTIGIIEAELLDSVESVNDVSPNNKVLAHLKFSMEADYDIAFRHLEKGGEEQIISPNRGAQFFASFSPDGKYVAYTSNESGRFEVYVQRYPLTGERWIVSTNGGEEPHWSPVRQELYYRKDNTWTVVPFTLEPQFSPGIAKTIFEGNYTNVPGMSYDISPDGNRFLLKKPLTEKLFVNRLKVVKNWR